MELYLISYYFAKNGNKFKSFLLISNKTGYLISLFNNKITIIRSCKIENSDYYNLENEDFNFIKILKKLVFSNENILPVQAKYFFENNYKKMNKIFFYEKC